MCLSTDPVLVTTGVLVTLLSQFQAAQHGSRDCFGEEKISKEETLPCNPVGSLIPYVRLSDWYLYESARVTALQGLGFPLIPSSTYECRTKYLDQDTQFPLNTWKGFSRRTNTNKHRLQILQ